MPVEYETVIGLEVHAQLLTKTKIFCGCEATFGAAPNTHVCPTCLGLPGALPALNAEAVALAVRAGLALGCSVRSESRFARKNYFYPDLPKGYQISQYDRPLCEGGGLEVPGPDGAVRFIPLERIHLEEDAGKNLHGALGADVSLVDLNRAGVPLVEIVGRPALRAPSEAAEYLRQLRSVLMFLGVNDGNLEEGSFRCDANVSVRPAGERALGTRVEIKNVNSFRFVQRALEWEVAHQVATVSAGGRVEQVTKTWDEAAGRCVVLRRKEASDDYRYFPDPDLPPLVLSEAWLDSVRASLPELPAAKRARYASLGLTPGDARTLTEHPALAGYFEDLSQRSGDPKRAANWVCNVVKTGFRARGLEASFPVTAEALAELLALMDDDTLSGKLAKEVYGDMAATGQRARAVADARGLKVERDEAALEALCRAVLEASPKQVEAFRAGKKNLLGYFKGEVMKATRGKADPRALDAVLARLLAAD